MDSHDSLELCLTCMVYCFP